MPNSNFPRLKKKIEPKKHHWIILVALIATLSLSLIFFSPLKSLIPQTPHIVLNVKTITSNLNNKQLETWHILTEIIQNLVGIVGLAGGAFITWKKILAPGNKNNQK